MDHLTEQDAGLLEQAASMLEGLANDERNRGNCSSSEGAACSAHAIRRLAPAMLRAGHGCLAQIEEPALAAPEAPASDLFDCEVRPHPLRYPLAAYHHAPGNGPLHATWQDKPHRIVYDLVAAVRHYAALAAAPQAPAGLDELRKIAEIAACWGCDHPDEPGDTEVVRRVKWAARQLRAVAQAPAAPSSVATQVIENLLQLARIVNVAVEDWGETKEDDSLHVIFHKEQADKLEEILEFFDSLPDAPESEGVILSGPNRAQRVLRAMAAPAAPTPVAWPVARDVLQRWAQFAEQAMRMQPRDMRNNMETLAEELTKLSALAPMTAPAAPAVDAAAPIDGCTDPYNCARCKTHPAHRGDMHHAGISGKGGSA